MAFAAAGLERLSNGLHKYRTTDPIATVAASGYFDQAAAQLQQFDIIHVISGVGGTPVFDNAFVSSATKATPVTIVTTEGVTATATAGDEDAARLGTPLPGELVQDQDLRVLNETGGRESEKQAVERAREAEALMEDADERIAQRDEQERGIREREDEAVRREPPKTEPKPKGRAKG